MRRRGLLGGCALALAVAVIRAPIASAGVPTTSTAPPTTIGAAPTTTAPEPLVRVVGAGDATSTVVWRSCYGTPRWVVSLGSVRVRSDRAMASDVVVAFDVAGPAVDPADYVLVGGSPTAVIPAGGTEAVLEIEGNRQTQGSSLTLTLVDGAGYAVGSPASAEVAVTSQWYPECGPPTFTDASANVHQVMPVGATPLPLEIVPFGDSTPYVHVVSGGALPPGMTLTTGGVFVGGATEPGTWTFEVEACTPIGDEETQPDFLDTWPDPECDRTSLTIVVEGGAAVAIPVTG